MVSRKSLAAVLRAARSITGSSREEIASEFHPTYLYKLENAKNGASLDKLGEVANALDCDLLALLLIASAIEMQVSDEARLQMVAEEIDRLNNRGLVQALAAQMESGSLKSQRNWQRLSAEKVEAVLSCRERGLTQKQTVEATGVSASTVHRIWHRDPHRK